MKTFKVKLTQTDTYTKTVSIKAKDAREAEALAWEKYGDGNELQLETESGTFESNDLSIDVIK